MRLWTVHPKYLDGQGLTALWREALLAQAVLRGATRGYRAHPQLARFRESARPLGMISAYLREVLRESRRRGYRFDGRKILGRAASGRLATGRGQLTWEWKHLRRKLRARSPECFFRWRAVAVPRAHPLFRIVTGERESWERG